MQDMPRETSSVPKTSSVSSFAVLTEHRLVKDRQTDGRTDGRTERHRAVAYNALCLCGVSAGAERVGHWAGDAERHTSLDGHVSLSGTDRPVADSSVRVDAARFTVQYKCAVRPKRAVQTRKVCTPTEENGVSKTHFIISKHITISMQRLTRHKVNES